MRYQCTFRWSSHTFPPIGPHIHQNHTSAFVFCCLCLFGWVCSHSSRRRMAGTGGVRGGRAAFWSWQVDSICIWHTDCTKYANRQTMTFAVLFFLWYCSLSVKSTKREHACCCAGARFIHLPGVSISLSRPNRPRPRCTNHMKGSPSLRIALSKATLMFENGDGCLWKKGLQVYQCQGRGKTVACLMLGAFLTANNSPWLPDV